MASWGLLDEKEENELHKSRLLNVEEKPFKRVTKRLSTLNSLIVSQARRTARQTRTPPPDSNDQDPAADHDVSSPADSPEESFLVELMQIKEDMTLDFAAFDSSIARLQFLMTANEQERERYAAERERIIKTSQAVRDNTVNLRIQLDQARATLEQRKKFDELADKITSNPSLRTRTEQAANLSKLEEEIAELEAESKTYGVTWQERRDQFARIMDESMRLRRLIRDEKEEVERREGMDDGDGGDAEAGQTPRPGLVSGSNTPRPESGLIPKSSGHGTENGDMAGTPRPLSTTGGRTPARDSPAPGQDSQSSYLKPRHDLAGALFSRSESQVPSREASVDRGGDRDGTVGGGDVDMDEVKNENEQEEDEEPDSPLTPLPSEDTPQIVVDGEDGPEDKMDTT